MATEYTVPDDTAFYSQNITVLNSSFTMTLEYNSTDYRWRFTIENSDGVLLQGVPLKKGYSPTKRYSLDELEGGNFWVFAKTSTDDALGYDNFGFDKAYGLYFLTTEEEEALGL